jgi:single-strand DNA-binding protein
VYTTDIVVEEHDFCEGKGNASVNSEAPKPAPADADGFMHKPDGVDDEGLPF